MTLAGFKGTPTAATPPRVAPLLLALWHDARGEWEKAHALAQDVDDASGAWVHAYLHRKEGDLGNAGYWYRRAGQPVATDSLDAEWNRIVSGLLRSHNGVPSPPGPVRDQPTRVLERRTLSRETPPRPSGRPFAATRFVVPSIARE